MNMDSEVAGVISSGGGENLAFAVSAALMKRVIPSLIKTGDYDYSYLGIDWDTVTPSIAKKLGLDRPRGVLVDEIGLNTSAAGTLREGDIIIAINGRQIDTVEQLASYLALETSPGDTVEITVLRNGEQVTVTVTLGTRPERPGTYN